MIFYFSATGNSKFLANIIGNKCGEELVDITQCVRNKNYTFSLGENEMLGFVMPVYFYTVPSAVRDFLEKAEIKFKNEPYIFTAFTCGATTSRAGKVLKNLLLKKGIHVNAEFAFAMVDNYIPMYEIADMNAARSIIEAVKPDIEKAAEKIKSKECGDFNKIKGSAMTTALTSPLYRLFRSTKRFYVKDSCTSCGKCESGCISGAIEIKNGKPVWVKSSCTNCLRCIHNCPQRAIQLGKGTEKRNRYVNPFVKL